MSSAATIVLARDDLSIPGTEPSPARADAMQKSFFALVNASNPDAIVLDFRKVPPSGADTILTIRRRSAVPILVVCDPAHPQATAYRRAGAFECISAPVDPLCLSRAVRRALRITDTNRAQAVRRPTNFSFAGITFYSERNALVADDGSSAILTNRESLLLAHFLSRPRTLCSRAQIREFLYGRDDVVGSRALDSVVNRLRKKISRIVRPSASSLIKTKIRCGYWLAADVMALGQRVSAQPW